MLALPQLIVDLQARRVTCNGLELFLTEREYALLAFLARNPGQVLTHDQLVLRLWPHGEVTRSNLHTLVGRLRQKVGALYIVNHRGMGYRAHSSLVQGEITVVNHIGG